MDEQAKKTALRRIPYGLFLLTAKHGEDVASATVNWVTQTSFKPPLVAVGVKAGTHPYDVIKSAGSFALHPIGAGQQELAETFFRTIEPSGNQLGPLTFRPGTTGAPVINELPAYWECQLRQVLEEGDHHVFLGEVVEAGVNNDTPTLLMRDTPWNYGG